jgi:hypothetical protein
MGGQPPLKGPLSHAHGSSLCRRAKIRLPNCQTPVETGRQFGKNSLADVVMSRIWGYGTALAP